MVLTAQRFARDEISTYMTDELQVGGGLELHGPIGSYFVWDGTETRPTQLIAGGSGIVPFRAMLRHRAALVKSAPIRLLYSARSLDDVIYRDELMRFAAFDEVDIHLTLTRASRWAWRGQRGRIGRSLIESCVWTPPEMPLILLSGPTGFVEAVADALVEIGHHPEQIRTERLEPAER
jgi:ferredoxin-NADP reductase